MMNFSIIICTSGRLSTLRSSLESLRFLTYPKFEVCLVCGPNDDGTKEFVIRNFPDAKMASCDRLNLSAARNIGIAMSAGEVVVFLDDDAIPEPEWLDDLAQSFSEADVGGAGGFVYDNTGVAFQAMYMTTNRLGYPDAGWSEPADHLNFPLSLNYPHLLGTNAAFRRSALLEIGGFDEEFEYFLDETDVCCRMVDACYKLVQRPDAFVHHKFAPSHIRDERNIVRNWYPLLKNRVYFGLRNGRRHHSFREIVAAGLRDAQVWEAAIESSIDGGHRPASDISEFRNQADAAIRDGIERGNAAVRVLISAHTLKRFESSFREFHVYDPGRRRSICFVTQDFPPGQNGGIARYISELARSLSAIGHNVHVFTIAKGTETVEFEDGVWVHRLKIRHKDLPPSGVSRLGAVPQHIWNYSSTMLEAVKDVARKRCIDAVYCPLWDCEAVSFVVDGSLPLICSLQTTMMMWLESNVEKTRDVGWMQTFGEPIMNLERHIVTNVSLVHSISRAIAIDIEEKYGVEIPRDRLVYAPLGLPDWAGEVRTSVKSPGCTKILFVGRLERRKGIDVLLRIAPALLKAFPGAVLEIVGDDTIPRADGLTYRAAFHNDVIDPGILPRIVFRGRLPERELWAAYESCDIFVAPSRYESFGLVLLEAMMFGKPVVACRAGGMPEIVQEGVTGLLVEPGDPFALQTALQTLLSDCDLRERMGIAGRRIYEQRFTVVAMRDELLKMIDCLDHSEVVIGA